MRRALYATLALLSACAAPRSPPDVHVPPFARIPYQPFSREAVVAIALREWRLFGSAVDDDPPGSYRPATPDDKPERRQGLWQRIGEYWWLAMNAGAPEPPGRAARRDRRRISGERGRHLRLVGRLRVVCHANCRCRGALPVSAGHSDYINLAKQMKLGQTSGWLIVAEPLEAYAPQPGDLICLGRGGARDLRYDDLPAGHFPGHCDIVVDTSVPGQISVVGGNVDDAVTLKHVPVASDGRLATPDGQIIDPRYKWMVVLRLQSGVLVS